MQNYEFTYSNVNIDFCTKPITVLVLEPECIGPETGVMLFSHGWGGNRFQHQDKMEYARAHFDLVAVSVEYRQSGYDFDPIKGSGADVPYDANFMQVFDVLNGLRKVLELRPGINRSRIFHYGASQGGGISLLSSIFAPRTFGFVYASCPVTHLDEKIQGWAGRAFTDFELSIRNAIEHADLIRCPVYLEHGTADTTVSCDTHTRVLEAKLKALGKKHKVIYYEGGEHSLEPTITKMEAFKAMAEDPMRKIRRSGEDDFAAGSVVEIPCGSKMLRIDWSQPVDSLKLIQWQ